MENFTYSTNDATDLIGIAELGANRLDAPGGWLSICNVQANKAEAEKLFPAVASMIDKLAKNNVIHNNKASNLKSGLTKHIASL